MATAENNPTPLQIERAETALKKIRALMSLISTSNEVVSDDDMRLTAEVIHGLAQEGLTAIGQEASAR